jgi:hypothetical protein
MFKIGDVLLAKSGIESYYLWNYTTLLVIGIEPERYTIIVLNSMSHAIPVGYKKSFHKKFTDANYASLGDS